MNLKMLIPATLCAAAPMTAWAQEAREPGSDEETIVVTATRTQRDLLEVPAAITVQDIDTLRRDGFVAGSDEFRGVPGVTFRRGEGDSDEFPFVSMRGSPGTDGYLTLLDGIPFVGIFEEPFLAEVPYNALQQIEVVKGPLSALYGRGALYGAVNYITASPRSDRNAIALSAGSDDFYRLEGLFSRRLGDNAGLLVGGAYENSQGWREGSHREIWSVYGKVGVDLDADTTLTAFAHYLDRFTRVPNGLPLTPQGQLVDVFGGPENFLGFGEPFNDTRGGLAWARIEHRAGESLTLNVTAHYRRFERATFLNFYDAFGFDASRNVYGVNGFRNDTTHSVWFGEATARLELGRHTLVAGLSGETSTSSEFNRWSGQYGFTPECGFTFFLVEIDYRTGQVVNRDQPCFVIDLPQTSSHFRNWFGGAFLQDEWRITDRLTLTVGGRYDIFRRRATFDPLPGVGPGGTQKLRADAFSPRATLSYRTSFGLVYAGYGRGFNSNFGATFENDPVQYFRPETRPTTIDSYEIGIRGRLLDNRLSFEAAAFQTRQRNRRVIIPNPDAATDFSAPPNLVTFGQLYDVRGVELSVTARPWDGGSLRFNYTFLDPEWSDFTLNTFAGPVDLSGNTPTGVARNIIYVAAQQRVAPWLDLRATYEFYDDYYVTLNNRVRGGGYELIGINARITSRALGPFSLDLGVTNLFDEDYYFLFGGTSSASYATPGTPRQFRATLRADF